MNKAQYRAYINSKRWQFLRFAVRWRQQDRCALCGCVTPSLVVHHNDYSRVGKETPWDLIGLCKTCNARHHEVWKKKAESALTEQRELEIEPVG